ncbi:AIR synthase related protein [Sporomusa sp.]|uniref:AIR synthase related protein n=1 Tax=Sporomusa sp. TaxID=2078658 RepID=UPI002C153F0C|nr:AIR synthase related protein [Sporomusa sp.]HWR44724.1 AIR synthase related protein [Sporomusa sp.]
MNVKKVRDLTLVDLGQGKTMVIACDSCGSVGLKEGDVLKVPPFITGKYTARVAILEVLCTGAEVICLTNTICNEMDPTGKAIIQGIEEELKAAGIGEVVLTGSTEENFSTVATGLGITTVGLVVTKDLKVNNIKGDALLVAIGQPKVGQEVLASKREDIVDYSMIKQLLQAEEVYEIIPVGSKGILYEMQELARNNQLKLSVNNNIKIDINKSAGPSTVVIAAVSNNYFSKLDIAGSMELLGKVSLEI